MSLMVLIPLNPRTALLAMLATSALVTLVACGGDDGDSVGDDKQTAVIEQTPPEQGSTEQELEALEQELDPEETNEPDELEPIPDSERELLNYGETFQGEIATEGEERQFRFSGTESDLVRITVDGKNGMDPILTLLEPNRTEITVNDDLSSSNRDSLIIARLPTTGLQVIRVGVFGDSVGKYLITLEKLVETNDADDRVLSLGDEWMGTFGEPGDIDTFEFAGNEGEAVQVSVNGSIGVDAKMELFTPDGNFLISDDDSGHGLDAEILLELPTTGAYRVNASAVGNRIGDYTFSTSVIEESIPNLASDIEMIEAVGLTYLIALQGADSLTIFGLAGPEAISIWGWESAEDVNRDIEKLQSIGVVGSHGDITSVINGKHGRVSIDLDTGGAQPDTVRFDLTNTNGQWVVDFVQRFFVPNENSENNETT